MLPASQRRSILEFVRRSVDDEAFSALLRAFSAALSLERNVDQFLGFFIEQRESLSPR